MKKIFKWTLFAVATLSLVACGTTAQKTNSQQAKTEKAAKSSASDGQVEVSLKGGQYIKPPVLNDSEDGTYLALQCCQRIYQRVRFRYHYLRCG